jgi:hypothetical protein
VLKSYTNIEIPRQQPAATQIPARTEASLPPQQRACRRVSKRPELMHYNRLIALVALVNVAILYLGVTREAWFAADGVALSTLSNLVLGNIALAIIIRQQYVINLLFKIATSAPTSWPLAIRWTLGKVYHFGGLHVGGAVVGTLWYAILVGSLIYHRVNGLPGATGALVAVAALLLFVLLGIIALSLPSLRTKHHDAFERSHRFGGWTALLLFWVQTILFVNLQRGEATLGAALLTAPSVWVLILLTVSIALPWLRLRKVPIAIESPSNHVALSHFDYGVTPFAGSSTAVSRNPLLEWHSFANVPAPDQDGFRLTISRAGDWTGALIDDKPSHVWVKGIPTAGVGNIDKLFKRVVWVATGSGIGPCLPHLLAQDTPSRLVWSTRTPRETYGNALVDEILAVQPDAVIWDTNAKGRPDLVQLAYEAAAAFDAEAIICISNKKLTWQVVYGMESRGIPAYGAIWDS